MKVANFTLPGNIKHSKPDIKFIHAMAEYIDMEDGNDLSAYDLLMKLNLRAHYLVTPSGVIIQMLDPDTKGSHAKGHNSGTIGIEFLVGGLHTYSTFLEALKTDWVTDKQLGAGIELCRYLHHDLKIKGWARHDHTDPDRKYDPGAMFPYEELKRKTELI